MAAPSATYALRRVLDTELAPTQHAVSRLLRPAHGQLGQPQDCMKHVAEDLFAMDGMLGRGWCLVDITVANITSKALQHFSCILLAKAHMCSGQEETLQARRQHR